MPGENTARLLRAVRNSLPLVSDGQIEDVARSIARECGGMSVPSEAQFEASLVARERKLLAKVMAAPELAERAGITARHARRLIAAARGTD